MCKLDYGDYYISLYDMNDNFIMNIEDIKTAATVLNTEPKELYRKIRENRYIEYMGTRIKMFLYKKFNEERKLCK